MVTFCAGVVGMAPDAVPFVVVAEAGCVLFGVVVVVPAVAVVVVVVPSVVVVVVVVEFLVVVSLSMVLIGVVGDVPPWNTASGIVVGSLADCAGVAGCSGD